MSAWVYRLGVGLALVAVALAVTEWILSDPITEATCWRIRDRLDDGITEDDVQGMLGRPPDESGRGQAVTHQMCGRFRVWSGRRGSICVFLFDKGSRKVRDAFFAPRDARFLDGLRTSLGW